ncbi:unnamed protein product [Bursaphelenchus okinawaensis]|uniref:Uncharacterized protein n=1 Tax=Bursaphelenchus okinawaensis TaxID=465554 RepID=A0A811KV80_9BILA|nr:unnamed protein product [Bursaphelenchus okinawaensis]CAG9112110.1 unnamed protein product [Bursaphelenchus okinawaensis]
MPKERNFTSSKLTSNEREISLKRVSEWRLSIQGPSRFPAAHGVPTDSLRAARIGRRLTSTKGLASSNV